MATKTRHDLLMERIRSQYEGNKVYSPAKQEEEKRRNVNGFQKVVATGADVLDSLGTGIAKGLESVVDAGATLAGNVGSWFGADTDWAEDFVATDYVGDFKRDNMQGWNDYIQDSAIYDMSDFWEQTIHGSLNSIGNMLPAIGVGALTGGVGSMAMFGASAMGGGVEGALQQGHDLQTATNYGILEGGKEIALEAVGAGLGNKILGVFTKNKALRNTSVKFLKEIAEETGEKASRSLVKEMIKQSVGEGLEEVAGDLLEPFIQKITIDKDENIGHLISNSLNDIPMDFISGVLTGGIMNGFSTTIDIKQAGGVDRLKQEKIIEDATKIKDALINAENSGLLDDNLMKSAQNKLVQLYNEYEGYANKIKSKKGEGSEQFFMSEIGKEVMNDVKDINRGDVQDPILSERIKRFNEVHNKNIRYESVKEDKFREYLKEEYGEKFTEKMVKANAFVNINGKLVVNKDSKAYKEGKLFNKVGHEFLHLIEGTKEYEIIYNEFIGNLSEDQKSAILDMYGKKNVTDLNEEGMLKEALADYVGENIALNNDEFTRMLGIESKVSKFKEKIFGYKGSLDEKHRNIQKNIKTALKSNDLTVDSTKLSIQTDEKGDYIRADLTTEENVKKIYSTYENRKEFKQFLRETLRTRINSGDFENVFVDGHKVIANTSDKGKKNDIKSTLNEFSHSKSTDMLTNEQRIAKSFTIAELNNIFKIAKLVRTEAPKQEQAHRFKNVHFYNFRYVIEINGEQKVFYPEITFKERHDGTYQFYDIPKFEENVQSSNKKEEAFEYAGQSKKIEQQETKTPSNKIVSNNLRDVKTKMSIDVDRATQTNSVEPKKETTPKSIEIKEDYDASKNFKVSVKGEDYNVKGISWYETKSNRLIELEEQFNDEEISETKYYNQTDKISEQIEDEANNLEYILSELEDIDLDDIEDLLDEDIPSTKDLEKLLNYAQQIQNFIDDNGTVIIDFSPYLDEESNVRKLYEYLENKKTAEQKLKEAVKTSKPKVEKPKVENKIVKKNLQPTVQKAYDKIDAYEQKYGPHSSFEELEYEMHLTKPEMAMLVELAYQNGKIDESYKESLRSYLKVENLDAFEEYVKDFELLNGEKPKGVEVKVEETVEVKEEKVVNEKAQQFTNSYVTLLTEHANFDKDSITGDFSEVFSDQELEELNEYTKRIFEEYKTNGERFYGIDFLNKNINSLKAPVSTMEDTIMNVVDQFGSVNYLFSNQHLSDDINKLQAKLEILKNYKSVFINFANTVIKNKRQIFYNIERDGVKTPRKLSGKESDASRNAIWESCREDIDIFKERLDDTISQLKDEITKQGKEVAEYDGRYGRKVVDNNTAKEKSISKEIDKSEGNGQERNLVDIQSNVQKSNTTKQGREVHRPKSGDNNEGNNGEIQHTDVQTTRGKDNGIVEEPKEDKLEQKTIEKTEEVVKEAISVEEVAETTGKETTVVTEIKKVIIQNTRKVSVEDNAKTLKYGANLFNKKVYSIEGDANILRKKLATELKEKYKISFRALGEGYDAFNHKVMATLNSIDNITEDQRIDTITGYFLEHINTDNAEAKQFVRNVVSDIVHNGGKPSLVWELQQAHQKQNTELAKEKQMVIDDYYKKLLKQIDITNTYKQLVKELTAEFKTLTKSKNVDEKKIAKLEERIKKLTTEFNSRLDSKDKYTNQLKEELRALKKQVSAKNVEINTLKSENKALEKGKVRAERKKATAMTASYGQKVIDSSFYKMIDEFDFSELVGEGYTIEKPKFDSSFYDKITSALSKNQIDYAVKLFTDRIAEYDVVDKNGKKEKLKQDTETWKEFESEIKHAFTEFFDNAQKTPVQLMKEEVQKEHAIMKGTVALITTTNTIRNKLKKKHGVSQTLNKLAVDFVSDIAKPSLTSVRNGMYQEAVKNAYEKLTKKDANGKTLMDKFGEPFDAEILEKMKNLTGEVTVEQIEDMVKIARYVSSYLSKASGAELVDFNGKSKTVKEWAIEAMSQQRKLAGAKQTRKWLKRLSALRPDVVFKYMDGFTDGINTAFYQELLKGETKEHKTFIELTKDIREFYETEAGKEVKKNIGKQVAIGKVTATVGEYMSIWKLLQRDEAKTHIANSGFTIADSKGNLTPYHFSKEDLTEFAESIKHNFDLDNPESIYSQYLKETTKFFEKAKELKIITDNDVKGYSNVINGEYFPIKVVAHDRLAQMGEGWDFMSSAMLGSREYAFNSSVEGLKGNLEISSVEQVIQVYATQMSRYTAYAKTIDNINSVYNYTLTKADVKGMEGLYYSESLRTVMTNIFGSKNGISNVTNYYNMLLKDVQGIKTVKDGWFEKLRSKFATFQLCGNLKVIANQFSAMPTALKYIKPQYLLLAHQEIAKLGLDIKLEDMPVDAQYRIMEKSIISANTLSARDKAGNIIKKTTDVLGKGMEFADNLVIKTIWRASLLQCNNNRAQAEELFNKTIRETQGFNALERSALLRSENSLIKSMMMFTIQPSHNLSNVMEWWMHLRSGQKMNSADKKKYAGAIGGLLMEGALYTAIGLLFKYLLGKDEDDEYELTNILETFFNDNIMGMIPFLNNVEVDFDMTSGRLLQMNDFSVGAIGQLYDAVEEMQNVLDADANPMAKFKSFTTALGMATGIPTRNLTNYGMAMLKWTGWEGAYEMDIAMSGKSLYNKEAINDALDRRQMTKAKKYYEAYTNKIVPLDEKTTRELYNMYSCGYKDAYIKQIPYTIEGIDEDYTTDIEKFRATYSSVGSTLKKLTSHPMYTTLSDKKKEKLIKQVVNTHYNIAYKEQSGEALTTMEMLVSKGYNPTRTFIWLNEISEIKDTYRMTRKEAVQKYINRLPLMSNEKYLIYMLVGYKLPDDKVTLVKNFLRMKGLSYKDINQIFG